MSTPPDRPSAARPAPLRPTPSSRQSKIPPRAAPPLPHAKEPAHLPLHRRLLFPYDPPEKPLPPIVRGEGELVGLINERLYHLLALLLRAYLLPWYARLSPRDRTLPPLLCANVLVPIVSPILSHIQADPSALTELILLDLPTILGLHVGTYWSARAAVEGGGAWVSGSSPFRTPAGGSPGHEGVSAGTCQPELSGERHAGLDTKDEELERAYHARLPLPSVAPAPETRHTALTPRPTSTTSPDASPAQPTHAADNSPDVPPTPRSPHHTLSPLYLTALSSALLTLHLPPADSASLVELLIARELLGRVVLASIARRLGEGWFYWGLGLKLLGEPGASGPDRREEREVKGGGHDVHAYELPTRDPVDATATTSSALDTILSLLLRAYTVLLGLWSLATSLVAMYSAVPPLEEKYRGVAEPWLLLCRAVLGVDGRDGLTRRSWRARIAFGLVELVVGFCGGWLDRFLPHLLRTHVLTPHTALRLIDLLEHLLFPGGYPGVSPPDPTPEETRDLRRRFEARLREAMPLPLQATFFPSPADLSSLLDPLDNAGCNAHLVGMLLDAVVAAVQPGLVVPIAERKEGDVQKDGGSARHPP